MRQLVTSIKTEKFEFIKKYLNSPSEYEIQDEGDDYLYFYRNFGE